ncbi:MAG: DUF1015 domain-containing protein [Verrucomicrobiaceae bacterium]|nr:DUF1015 domain-containing protein [Verrucomicrobiaceae bacterium]
MKIKAFKGLRPTQDKAEAIASLPYDVVNFQQACKEAEGKPLSFMRVVRSELELDPSIDPYSEPVYAHAKENFQKLVDGGHMVREDVPSMYLYRQQMGEHSQTGLVATFSAEDYDNDVIKKHEKTREAKENDRYRLTRTLRVNTGPVFLTVKDGTLLDQIVENKKDEDALFDFVAEDGIRHSVWKISDPEILAKIVETFDNIPCAYVADGHHRSASNARCARLMKADNPNHTGDEDYNWFLSVCFPAGQLKILPYNRVVKDLAGNTKEQFLEKLGKVCKLTKSGQKAPEGSLKVSMYLDGQWYSLEFENTEGLDAVSSLDVALLQDRVLSPLLNIGDPRTDERIDFVGGIKGTDELERLVNEDGFAVAFSMYPTTVAQLMAIADAGQIMPPKSTWFEPKLRSGLFVHTF